MSENRCEMRPGNGWKHIAGPVWEHAGGGECISLADAAHTHLCPPAAAVVVIVAMLHPVLVQSWCKLARKATDFY